MFATGTAIDETAPLVKNAENRLSLAIRATRRSLVRLQPQSLAYERKDTLSGGIRRISEGPSTKRLLRVAKRYARSNELLAT